MGGLFPPGVVNVVDIRTYKPKQPLEKYGRWLAEVFLPDGSSVAELMVAAGHAVPYEGGAR
jgi:endonuclease YncB( thermonuclease family)